MDKSPRILQRDGSPPAPLAVFSSPCSDNNAMSTLVLPPVVRSLISPSVSPPLTQSSFKKTIFIDLTVDDSDHEDSSKPAQPLTSIQTTQSQSTHATNRLSSKYTSDQQARAETSIKTPSDTPDDDQNLFIPEEYAKPAAKNPFLIAVKGIDEEEEKKHPITLLEAGFLDQKADNGSKHYTSKDTKPPETPRSHKLKRPSASWIARFKEKHKTPPQQCAERTSAIRRKNLKQNNKRKRAMPPLCVGRTTVKRTKNVYDDFESPPSILSRRAEREHQNVSNYESSFSKPYGDTYGLNRSLTLKEAMGLERSDSRYQKRFEEAINELSRENGAGARSQTTETGTVYFKGSIPQNMATQVNESLSYSLFTNPPPVTYVEHVPTFLEPHTVMLYIKVQGNIFALYRDFVAYHLPVLYEDSRFSTCPTTAMTSEVLGGVSSEVFGLLVNWMYSTPHYAGLGTAIQEDLMKLWVLGKLLEKRQLQNDALDALEARRIQEGGKIQTEGLEVIYRMTTKGDMLRSYTMHVCARSLELFSDGEIEEGFPRELVKEIEEARFFKTKDEGKLSLLNLDINAYHVR